MNILLINDFLPWVDRARELALNQEYFTAKQYTEMYKTHTDWPGRRTEHVLNVNTQYANSVLSQIAHIADVKFGLKNVSIKSYFHIATESDGDSWVHQDNDVDLAAVLYLTPNAPLTAGTTLYKCNNEKRWQSYTNSQEGYQTLKQINRKEKFDLYNELFTPTAVINNIYNSLVMYKGDTFHKSNDYFGTDIETGRLTQVFFITQEK